MRSRDLLTPLLCLVAPLPSRAAGGQAPSEPSTPNPVVAPRAEGPIPAIAAFPGPRAAQTRDPSPWSLGTSVTFAWTNDRQGPDLAIGPAQLFVERALSRHWRLLMNGEAYHSKSARFGEGQSSTLVTVSAGARRILNPGSHLEVSPWVTLHGLYSRSHLSPTGGTAHGVGTGITAGILCEHALSEPLFVRLSVDLANARHTTASSESYGGDNTYVWTGVVPAVGLRLVL